jgi:hypothetical protein
MRYYLTPIEMAVIKKTREVWVWWYIPIISATGEMKGEELQTEVSPRKSERADVKTS